jgi:hypothetical protein
MAARYTVETVDNLPYLCGSVGFSILAFFLRVLACVQQVWASLGACWLTSALSEGMDRGEGVDSARPAAAYRATTRAASSLCAPGGRAVCFYSRRFGWRFFEPRFRRHCNSREQGATHGMPLDVSVRCTVETVEYLVHL